MGKKMKLIPFVSQSKSLDTNKVHYSSLQQWPFPSCGNIKTLSFRDDDAFRTFNSAYIDHTEMTNASTESFFTVSSSSRSFSTMSEEFGDPVEAVIRGLRSDRFFFEPEQSCSLVLHKEEEEQQQQQRGSSSSDNEDMDSPDDKIVYKESELMSMDSSNPYEDFRRSMEEMVEAHGLKDWQGLEELLGCYLKINGENNHGYIMGAFIDLLVSLSFSSTTTTNSRTTPTTSSSSSSSSTTSSLLSTNMNCSSSPCSPLSLPSSSLTTPCLSSLLDHDDDNDDDEHDDR